MTIADIDPRAAAGAVGGGPMVATATVHGPVDAVATFEAALHAGWDASLWLDPANGRTLLGIDAAIRLAAHGPTRFEELAEGWRATCAAIRVEGDAAGSPLAGPMLLGGATFRDQPSDSDLWAGFRTAAFDVPRVLLASQGGRTVLTTVAASREGSARGAMLLDELAERHRPAPHGRTNHLAIVGAEPDRAAWASSVARITGAVGRGRLDKVVLARRVDLVAVDDVDVGLVLRRLEAADRPDPTPGARLTSTLFAFARAGRVFLGSTPERVASVRGHELRTMALAGTTARGSDAVEDAALGAALLASEKEREEHAVVVGMLRATLGPLARDLELPRSPRVVRAARVQHLLTDVTGRLRPGVGLLDVVARLHPTPAVAGWPTDAALELLDEETGLDRGWYAGPVGWVDRAGDGDVAVAIRSGVVAGRHASLLAGCGVVADSEPDREWDESALKLRVMGDALGWSGA